MWRKCRNRILTQCLRLKFYYKDSSLPLSLQEWVTTIFSSLQSKLEMKSLKNLTAVTVVQIGVTQTPIYRYAFTADLRNVR